MQSHGEDVRTTAAEWLFGNRSRRKVAGHCAGGRVAQRPTAHLPKDWRPAIGETEFQERATNKY